MGNPNRINGTISTKNTPNHNIDSKNTIIPTIVVGNMELYDNNSMLFNVWGPEKDKDGQPRHHLYDMEEAKENCPMEITKFGINHGIIFDDL